MPSYRDRADDLLAGLDPVTVLRASPGRLEDVRQRLGADGLARSYRAGAWTGQELLAHLADTELVLGFRLRQTLAAGGGNEVQRMDQDAWSRPYARLDPDLALGAFRALRDWNLTLLARLDLDAWLLAYRNPELGREESLDEMVRIWAAHDVNHLEQLERIQGG